MSQLPLPIGWPGRGDRDSLLIHAANSDAVALLRAWGSGASHCFLLTGPRKAGRSLIGAWFAAEAGAVVIDDAQDQDEQHLFNVWNETRDAGQPLLLIAQEAPPVWAVTLADLRTRLAAAPVARIAPPDESVAAALIAYGLERAGSAFAPDVPEFVARRTERCYETIDATVQRLNAQSLASGQKISVAATRGLFCNETALSKRPDRTL